MNEMIPRPSDAQLRTAPLWVLCVVLGMSVPLAGAQPSDDHAHLSGAANWAVTTSNIELLKSLLQAGVQINEPVEKEAGWTLLHFAASSGTERVVRFLMDNGADPCSRDQAGLRPIDLAYRQSRTNICQVLTNEQPSSHTVGGYPEGVLEIVFGSRQNDAVLVTINRQDPSDELLKWLRRVWPNAVPGSKGELVAATASSYAYYRNTENGQKMAGCAVTIEKLNEREYSWFTSFGAHPLGGWHEEGKMRQEYGYWIVTDTDGGVH
ncbi:MAG: ankyrin repeat domain-containing protein [Kiritimatiellae bacterium]|nr:ankyrin repeat domain-containing protein [Kiritimatiellia bacterium]